jgi:hypothetical protein
MTRDDIIRLALEHFGAVLNPSDMEVKLAVLAVAAEREACALLCEETRFPDSYTAIRCAAAIRERSEQEQPR